MNLHSAGQWTVKATDTASHFFGISGTITVQPGPPAKLAFQTQPGNTFVGVAIPNFMVEVLDADDNLVDNDNGNLPISIGLGANPTGVAVLSGTTSVDAVHGVATFTGLMLNKAATGYTLKARSGTLTEAPSVDWLKAPLPDVHRPAPSEDTLQLELSSERLDWQLVRTRSRESKVLC